jgi:hypothetical protein
MFPAHTLPHRLTGNPYWDFPLHDLTKLLSAVRTWIWCSVLCQMFSVTPIMTAWPPHSPDLNPLCEHPNAAPVDNEGAHRVVDACQTVRNCQCDCQCRGHLEHLLQVYSLSYNSQIKCFRHTRWYGHGFLFLYVKFVPIGLSTIFIVNTLCVCVRSTYVFMALWLIN